MANGTASNPAADSHTQARIASSTAAAQAAEAAAVRRLHAEAARDYRAGQTYRNANSNRTA